MQRLINWRFCGNLLLQVLLPHITTTSVTSCNYNYSDTSSCNCYLWYIMYLLSTAVLLWSLRRITLDPAAACFDQSVRFPNPTVCPPSSQGKRCCDKMSQKSCDNNASWSRESKCCNNTAASLAFWSSLWKAKTRDRDEDLGYPELNGSIYS